MKRSIPERGRTPTARARYPGFPRKPLRLALAQAVFSFQAIAVEVPAPESELELTLATEPAVVTSTKTAEPAQLNAVQVVGRRRSLVGEAISASEGAVGRDDMADRPVLRTGDLLELVPGLVATQHSGSGKANQYFLRGFNLDHGTDFATYVDGMPVNMRSHGHGQGWTDLNFLIPETVEELTYRKGTYYADVGDFSSAGSATFRLADTVMRGQVGVTAGQFGYLRGVLVNSVRAGSGDLLYGLELESYNGPWTDIEEDVRKASILLRYSVDLAGGRAHLNFMGYDNQWNSADQIPQRAIDQGLVSRFGSLDTTVGARASRYSLSAGWKGTLLGGEFSADAFAIDSTLDLFSNFTYFLDDPVNGDQFEQVDKRQLYGFSISQQWEAGRGRWRLGAEGRYDDIGQVGLYRTAARRRLSTVREDSIGQGSLGVFVANEFRFNDKLRSYVGVRRDFFRFEVESKLAANSGERSEGITSYKASLAYQPVEPLEIYASYGTGFHSNDARGTTITIDPSTGGPAQAVDPLVGSEGMELGSRIHFSKRLHATFALWSLKLDSELLFVGDAGTTEASRPSRRQGVESGLYWYPSQRYAVNLEASYTRSRFQDADPVGQEISGSIPLVVSSGVTGHFKGGWMVSAQLKHFGRYPLAEDGSVESDGSTIINLRVGREWRRLGLHLDLLNALDSEDHDVDYFYASRLSGEPAQGVEDFHFHAFPPRSIRLSLRYGF